MEQAREEPLNSSPFADASRRAPGSPLCESTGTRVVGLPLCDVGKVKLDEKGAGQCMIGIFVVALNVLLIGLVLVGLYPLANYYSLINSVKHKKQASANIRICLHCLIVERSMVYILLRQSRKWLGDVSHALCARTTA